jgi:hypothetical protein
MEHYQVNPTKLKVGNAYDTMDMLLNTQTITL